LFVWTQPLAGLQPSVVHSFPSLQLGGGPPTHEPAEQVSFVVQALPSLHITLLLVWVQPVAGLQASVVQTFPSSQLGGGPPRHEPPEQASLVVQAFPSLQGRVFGMCWHSESGSQVSSVHRLPSSQLGGAPPTHSPPEQVSLVVQAFPSSHGNVLLTCTQPLTGWQESSVQTFPSSQVGGVPPWHVFVVELQVSAPLQKTPSSQWAAVRHWTTAT